MTNPIERIFLGWTAPALETAATRLVDHYHAGEEVRMDGATAVLPGARAGRRLRELLLEEAGRREARLIPPRVTTTGALPELLYEPERALAEPILAGRVWVQALRELGDERIARVFPAPPAPDDLAAWRALVRQVERLHREVGGAGLRFRDVAEHCRDGLLFDDGERWRVLADAQHAYLARLRELGYDDREMARLDACERGTVATDRDLWLIGVVDAPPVVRRMLAEVDTRVRALVHAPPEREADFDAVGCVRPEAWQDVEIPVADDRLRIGDRPADQAAEALRGITMLDARVTAEEITIGVPDAQVVPYLEQRLSAAGVPVRYAAGVPLARTGPYRLLAALAAYVDGRRFDTLAALLRHPAVGRWLGRAEVADGVGPGAAPEGAASLREIDAALGVADRYHAETLPARVAGPLAGGGALRARMAEAVQAIESDRLVGRLRGRKRMAEWAPEILELLAEVYGAEPIDRGDAVARRIVDACERIRTAAAGFHRLPDAVDERCAAGVAIRLLLDEVASESVPADPDRAAIELLGWLELHLDDAAALIVTGLNEPHVPESVNADAFLPNALRARLGLPDNDGRYARDAYSLAAVLHSCPEVWLIAGRQDASGNPLRPSRLLFAAEGRVVARRVRRFFGGDAGENQGNGKGKGEGEGEGKLQGTGLGERRGQGEGDGWGGGGGWGWLPPEGEVRAAEVIGALRVTDFRGLLQDPYRWALERVLGLERLDDEAREMDGALFGSLAHDVLHRFGVSDEAGLTDGDAIARRLDALLDEVAGRRFGGEVLPAVGVQVEQLRARLHAFAAWHADWIGQGWRVAAVEVGPPDGVGFEVDGEPFVLRGRIDRIDHHPATGAWAVFDYKTSDVGHEPEKTHRKGRGDDKEWVDLQLPLYRHLLPELRREDGSPLIPPDRVADVRLGYILLPRELDAVGAAFAEWAGPELAAADDAARQVVRMVRGNRFVFDPSRVATFPGDPLGRLLGLGQLAGVAADDDTEGDDA